ncbi:MAG: hypothetical protein K2P33_06040 [Acutalibacter sp.]|nr:hypothetical protein [Acutalibacter sp.]
MTVELEAYLKEVDRRLLVCPKQRRLSLLKELRGNISAFLDERPQTTAQEVRACFGAPEEIAAGFLKSLPDEELNEQLQLRKRIFNFVRMGVVAAVVAGILLLGFFVYDTYLYNHGETTYEAPIEGAPPPDESAISLF